MSSENLDFLRGEGGVDSAWYLRTYPDVAESGVDPVAHYLNYGWKEGRDPRPTFSTRGYLQEHPDVAESRMNPFVHYLRFGAAERRDPGLHWGAMTEERRESIQWRYLYEQELMIPRHGTQPPVAGQPFGGQGVSKIVFAGHDATRTGAPLLLLELMRFAAKQADTELYLFLGSPGPLLEEYAAIAHVVVNTDGVLSGERIVSIPALLQGLAGPAPSAIILNSIASVGLLPGLAEAARPLGTPVVYLVHEQLYDFSDDDMRLLLASSDEIAFPSEASRRFWIARDPAFEKAVAVHHGLLNPAYGKADRQEARDRIRGELGIPRECPIVLAMGTRSIRKGVDLYLHVARRVIDRYPGEVHFIWLGSHVYDAQEYNEGWIRWDHKHMGLESRVHLLDSRTDTESFHLASDVFLLPSRDDSFPFVVLEAMACRVPLVTFAGSGGAVEAIGEDAGVAVSYLSIEEMADATIRLLEDPEYRCEMGRRAEARVRSRYQFGPYAERLFALARLETSVSTATDP